MINNLFQTLSRTDREHMYPVTRMLNKSAIIWHYLTRNFSKKLNPIDLCFNNDYYFPGPPGKVLNAIQVEELRLAEDLACAVSHYSEGVLGSNLMHKLEVLDISENILKSLRMLCEQEFACQRIVMEERL